MQSLKLIKDMDKLEETLRSGEMDLAEDPEHGGVLRIQPTGGSDLGSSIRRASEVTMPCQRLHIAKLFECQIDHKNILSSKSENKI